MSNPFAVYQKIDGKRVYQVFNADDFSVKDGTLVLIKRTSNKRDKAIVAFSPGNWNAVTHLNHAALGEYFELSPHFEKSPPGAWAPMKTD